MQAKLMEMAALSTLIGNIGRQRVAFDTAVQEAAVEVIGQSIVHRNVTPANQLLDVIGAHLKPALVAHLEKFGNMAWSKADKKIVFFDVEKITGDKLDWNDEYRTKVAEALWFKTKKEAEPKSVYDVAEEAEKFLERLAKAGKKGVELKHKGLYERLLATYNRYQAETYLASTTALPTTEEVKSEDAQGNRASADSLRELQEKFGGRPTPVAVNQ